MKVFLCYPWDPVTLRRRDFQPPAASAQQDKGMLFKKELGVFPRKQRSQLIHHPLPPDHRPHTTCTTGSSISASCDEKDWGGSGEWTTMGFPSSPGNSQFLPLSADAQPELHTRSIHVIDAYPVLSKEGQTTHKMDLKFQLGQSEL